MEDGRKRAERGLTLCAVPNVRGRVKVKTNLSRIDRALTTFLIPVKYAKKLHNIQRPLHNLDQGAVIARMKTPRKIPEGLLHRFDKGVNSYENCAPKVMGEKIVDTVATALSVRQEASLMPLKLHRQRTT